MYWLARFANDSTGTVIMIKDKYIINAQYCPLYQAIPAVLPPLVVVALLLDPWSPPRYSWRHRLLGCVDHLPDIRSQAGVYSMLQRRRIRGF